LIFKAFLALEDYNSIQYVKEKLSRYRSQSNTHFTLVFLTEEHIQLCLPLFRSGINRILKTLGSCNRYNLD